MNADPRYLLAATILLLLVLIAAAGAIEPSRVVIHFFWEDGCPHCAEERPFLEDLARRVPQVELKTYEVWHRKENQLLFRGLAAAYGIDAGSVPTTFIGDSVWVGFNERIRTQIEAKVNACLKSGCPDPAQRMAAGPAPAQETITVPGWARSTCRPSPWSSPRP